MTQMIDVTTNTWICTDALHFIKLIEHIWALNWRREIVKMSLTDVENVAALLLINCIFSYRPSFLSASSNNAKHTRHHPLKLYNTLYNNICHIYDTYSTFCSYTHLRCNCPILWIKDIGQRPLWAAHITRWSTYKYGENYIRRIQSIPSSMRQNKNEAENCKRNATKYLQHADHIRWLPVVAILSFGLHAVTLLSLLNNESFNCMLLSTAQF